jgi:hypothetical protein
LCLSLRGVFRVTRSRGRKESALTDAFVGGRGRWAEKIYKWGLTAERFFAFPAFVQTLLLTGFGCGLGLSTMAFAIGHVFQAVRRTMAGTLQE